jgi:hypothetical protein
MQEARSQRIGVAFEDVIEFVGILASYVTKRDPRHPGGELRVKNHHKRNPPT